MSKSSSLCLYSSNLGTFWLKIKQFCPFEEISIFSNSGHLKCHKKSKIGYSLKYPVSFSYTISIIFLSKINNLSFRNLFESLPVFISSVSALLFCVGLWCLTPLSTIFQIPSISWRSLLLVEETGVPGKNHRPAASHW